MRPWSSAAHANAMGCGGSKEDARIAELTKIIDQRLHDGNHLETLRLLNNFFARSLVPKCLSGWVRFVVIVKAERAERDKLNAQIAAKSASMGEHVKRESFKHTFTGFKSRKAGFGEQPAKSRVHRAQRISAGAENEKMLSSIKSKLAERQEKVHQSAVRGWNGARNTIKVSNSILEAGREQRIIGASPPGRKSMLLRGSSRTSNRMSMRAAVMSSMSFSIKAGLATEMEQQPLPTGPGTPPKAVVQQHHAPTPSSAIGVQKRPAPNSIPLPEASILPPPKLESEH